MENKYLLLKDKHEKIINDFYIFYAFNEEQLKEGLKKLNTEKENLLTLGYGGFIKKEDEHNYIEMFKKINEEEKEALKDDDFLYSAFRYELANHEFCITYDYSQTLELFGLHEEDLTERQQNILDKAKEDYLANCDNE